MLLVSGALDFKIKIWNPFHKVGESIMTLDGHIRMITDFVVLNDK